MKTTVSIIAVLAFILCIGSCVSCKRAQPNHEAILMNNYGKNGMSDFEVITGSVNTLMPGTALYQVPMYELPGDPTEIKVTTKDGGVFTVDPQYTYAAERGHGKDIIFNYKYLGLSGVINAADMDNIESSVLNRLVLNAYREEARNYATDSLLTSINRFENNVESRLKGEFTKKFFTITSLTSGLKPPPSMTANIEEMNNAKVKTQTVKNELATANMLQQKAVIDAKTNEIKSQGFTKEVLAQQWIDAIRNSSNRIIITDGKTPVMFDAK